MKTYKLFVVPIGNENIYRKIEFLPEATVLKYYQQLPNSCCLGSLSSAFHGIDDKRAAPALENRIEESLTLQMNRFRNRIHFSNNIWEKGGFDILNDIR